MVKYPKSKSHKIYTALQHFLPQVPSYPPSNSTKHNEEQVGKQNRPDARQLQSTDEPTQNKREINPSSSFVSKRDEQPCEQTYSHLSICCASPGKRKRSTVDLSDSSRVLSLKLSLFKKRPSTSWVLGLSCSESTTATTITKKNLSRKDRNEQNI